MQLEMKQEDTISRDRVQEDMISVKYEIEIVNKKPIAVSERKHSNYF